MCLRVGEASVESKYPHMDLPDFYEEMASFASDQAIPQFDLQGEFAGKKKGRKPKSNPEPAAKKKAGKRIPKAKSRASSSKAVPKAKAQRRKETRKAIKAAKASKAKARKNSKPPAEKAEHVPASGPAARKRQGSVDGDSLVKPPSHVTTNHVYSSAYRKAKSQSNGDMAFAKEQAKKATKLFIEQGLVNWVVQGCPKGKDLRLVLSAFGL